MQQNIFSLLTRFSCYNSLWGGEENYFVFAACYCSLSHEFQDSDAVPKNAENIMCLFTWALNCAGVALLSKTSCLYSCALELKMHISAVFLLQSWKSLTPLGRWRNPLAKAGAVAMRSQCPAFDGHIPLQAKACRLSSCRWYMVPMHGYRLQHAIRIPLCCGEGKSLKKNQTNTKKTPINQPKKPTKHTGK